MFSLAALGIVSGSVVAILFPGAAIFPVFVFSFAIALALSRGFLESLPAMVVFGLSADLATLGRVGVLSGVAVGLAYTASFFSRRFIVEHAALTAVFSGFLAFAAAVFFPTFSDVVVNGIGGLLDRTADDFSFFRMLVLFVSGIISFVFASFLIRQYDELILRIDPGSAIYARRQKR